MDEEESVVKQEEDLFLDVVGDSEPVLMSNRTIRTSTRRSARSKSRSSDYKCPECDYVGDSQAEKNFHMRREHPSSSTSAIANIEENEDYGADPEPESVSSEAKEEEEEEEKKAASETDSPFKKPPTPPPQPMKPKRGRPRKSQPQFLPKPTNIQAEAISMNVDSIIAPRVTTKELISGTRKRTRPDLSSRFQKPNLHHDEFVPDPRIEALGVNRNMSVGHFLTSVRGLPQTNYKRAPPRFENVEQGEEHHLLHGHNQHQQQHESLDDQHLQNHQDQIEQQLTVTEEDLDDFMEIGREEEVDEVGEIDLEGDRRREATDDNSSYQTGYGQNNRRSFGAKMGGAAKKNSPLKSKTYDPHNIPFRLRVGDVDGRYKCYIKECEWKAAYRSMRMEHMKAVHPEWKMPSRYLLQRISRDGVYINPDDYVPPVACLVPNCPWRGNFRASRSTHMRTVHPEEHSRLAKKQANGSYNAEGAYLCHVQQCEWRGSSRSTRAQHMRRVHPGWKTENVKKTATTEGRGNQDKLYESPRECFACPVTASSRSDMINHIHDTHGLGMYVEQGFENKAEFTTWLCTVERLFHCSFTRQPFQKPSQGYVRYMLVCGCEATKNDHFLQSARDSAYTSFFLRRRMDRVITRTKIECCVYLDIREEKVGGKVFAAGCLEHTGHRWGLPLMRMTNIDRHFFHQFMMWRNARKEEMSMAGILDLWTLTEGFTVENLEPTEELVDFEPYDVNQIVSLSKLISSNEDLKDSSFGIELLTSSENIALPEMFIGDTFSAGFMNEDMKKYWVLYGAERFLIVEKSSVRFGSYSLTVFNAFVFDDAIRPKCCCVYLTTDIKAGYEAILKQLYDVDARPPRVFCGDPSQAWVDVVEKTWPQMDVEVQISEWTMMDYWAENVDKMIQSDFDKVFLLCALRKMIRISDTNQFLFFAVELFETLYELGYADFSKFIDFQMSDCEYFKRWSFTNRSELAILHSPTFAVTARIYRDRFLDTCGIDRIDRYFLHMAKRTIEFNQCEISETFTNRPDEREKTIFYPAVVETMASNRRIGRHREAPIYEEMEVVYDGTEGEIGVFDEPILTHVGEEKQRNEMHMGMMDIDGEINVESEGIVERKRLSSVSRPGPSKMPAVTYPSFRSGRRPNYTGQVKLEPAPPSLPVKQISGNDPAKKIGKHETTKSVIGTRRPRERSRYKAAQAISISMASGMSVQELAAQIIGADRRKGTRMPPDFHSYNVAMGISQPGDLRRRPPPRKQQRVAFDPNQPSSSTAVLQDPDWDNVSIEDHQ